MLEVVHVTKRYRKVLANDDINLTIEDGRIGVLLGPNGAGKSTIIKCIMGFLKYQGQIQVNVSKISPSRRKRSWDIFRKFHRCIRT